MNYSSHNHSPKAPGTHEVSADALPAVRPLPPPMPPPAAPPVGNMGKVALGLLVASYVLWFVFSVVFEPYPELDESALRAWLAGLALPCFLFWLFCYPMSLVLFVGELITGRWLGRDACRLCCALCSAPFFLVVFVMFN